MNPNLHANTYHAVTKSYLFFVDKPTQIEDPLDVEFFLNKGNRFVVYEEESDEVITNVEEYNSYMKKKKELEEDKSKLEKDLEEEEEPKEENSEPESSNDELPLCPNIPEGLEDPEEEPEDEEVEKPNDPEEEVRPSLEYVKEQAGKLKAKDFLKWIKQYGIIAKSEKKALELFEQKYGGNE